MDGATDESGDVGFFGWGGVGGVGLRQEEGARGRRPVQGAPLGRAGGARLSRRAAELRYGACAAGLRELGKSNRASAAGRAGAPPDRAASSLARDFHGRWLSELVVHRG